MVLRAGEEDRRRRGRVGAEGGGSVPLVLHRHQHQLAKVLLAGVHICRETQEWLTETEKCSNRDVPADGNVTVVLQLGVLPGTPPLDGPLPEGQHLGADFDDATQSAATRKSTLQCRRAKSRED